jgi:ubiquitin C-terminal hydrolase
MGKKKRSNRVSTNRPKAGSGVSSISKQKPSNEGQVIVELNSKQEITLINSSEISPKGLQNIGNTCFFNSVLQALSCVYSDKLHYEIAYSSFGNVTKALYSFISQHRNPLLKKQSYNPSELHSVISSKFKQFKVKRQQDAHELYLCLIGQIEEERKLFLNSLSKSDVFEKMIDGKLFDMVDIFEGEITSILTCLNCNHKRCLHDKCIDISVEIPGSEYLMKIDFSKFTKKKKENGSKNKSRRTNASETSDDRQEKDITDSESKPNQIKQRVENDEIVLKKDKKFLSTEDIEEVINNLFNDDNDSDACETSSLPVEPTSSNSPQLCDDKLSNDCHITTTAKPLKGVIDPSVLLAKAKQMDSNTIQLYECLDAFTKPEYMCVSEGNGICCEKCCFQVDNRSEKGEEDNASWEVVTNKSTKLRADEDGLNSTHNTLTVEAVEQPDSHLGAVDNCEASKPHRVNGRKRIVITSLPPIFVIHLKRLLPGGKQNCHVDFPLELDLTHSRILKSPLTAPDLSKLHLGETDVQDTAISNCGSSVEKCGGVDVDVTSGDDDDNDLDREVVLNPTLESITANVESHGTDNETTNESSSEATNTPLGHSHPHITTKDKRIVYNLKAVIVHQGGANGGHYVAYFHEGDQPAMILSEYCLRNHSVNQSVP